MSVKTYRVAFPVYATGFDSVDLDEAELKGKSEKEIKEIILEKISAPSVCHQCNHVVEEVTISESLGEDLEQISYWEEE